MPRLSYFAISLVRRVLRRTVATAAILAGLTGEVQAAATWPSGVACSGGEFGGWRGTPIDVAVGWAPWKTGWEGMVKYFAQGAPRRLKQRAPIVSIGVALLTRESAGQFGACADGKFDSYFRAIGQHLSQQGLGNAHIRLGWEASGDWYPWSIGNQAEAYKACFRRAAFALRSEALGLQINWHLSKKGRLKMPIDEVYPGNDVVDVIAISFPEYPCHSS